jgi:hypothetical protein
MKRSLPLLAALLLGPRFFLRDDSIMKRSLLFASAALVLLPALATADVKLPSVFASHMVVQRDKPLVIWGTADKDESVTVSFGEKTAYKLFNTKLDPEEKTDFAERVPHLAFRLKGLRERLEAEEFRKFMRKQ